MLDISRAPACTSERRGCLPRFGAARTAAPVCGLVASPGACRAGFGNGGGCAVQRSVESRLPVVSLRWLLGAALSLSSQGSKAGPGQESGPAANASASARAEEATPSLELEAWLDEDLKPQRAAPGTEPPEEPAIVAGPRRRGWVVEAAVGALGHLGDMKSVSPVAPQLRLQIGYELADWAMVAAHGDLALSSTRYAGERAETRAFSVFGFGLGPRLTWPMLADWSLYLQGEAGLYTVSEDVLATYGYLEADRFRLGYSALLGLEWYQVSPHYALCLYGGARLYPDTFARRGSNEPPLAWLGGLALRYAL